MLGADRKDAAQEARRVLAQSAARTQPWMRANPCLLPKSSDEAGLRPMMDLVH